MIPGAWSSQKWTRWAPHAAIGALIVLLLLQWESGGRQPSTCIRKETFDANKVAPDDFSAGNSSLGFDAILALSRGTKWRVDGLQGAAEASNITIQVPAQPVWSTPFVEAFQAFGPVEAHGAALAWLGHIDLLKYVVQSRLGSALILEDDVDWSVDIRYQTQLIADGVLNLTGRAKTPQAPYGTDWDVLWMGHCSDPPDFDQPHVVFQDNTSAPIESYIGINRYVGEVLKDQERMVHFTRYPVCTWAYAVTAASAPKLIDIASQGVGGAFDLMLAHACQGDDLRCITVNPQIFDPYHPAEGEQSEVRAGDDGRETETSTTGTEMGHTDNVLRSARCAARFQTTCLEGGPG